MAVPSEIVEAIESANRRIDARFSALEIDVREAEKRAGRLRLGGAETSGTDSGLTPEQAEHQKAFHRYLRRGEVDGLADLARKAINTSNDESAGYLITPEMDTAIDRIAETVGGLGGIARRVDTGSAKWETLVKTSGMAMRRVGEGQTGGETVEPTYAKVSIEVHTAEVEPWAYNETLEDSRVNLEQDLANEAAIGFAEGANAEFISGNGVGGARGILTYPFVANASWAWGSVGYIASGAAGDFPSASTSVNSADPLVDVVHALKSQYRRAASWLMNSSTAGAIRKIKDADGRHVWTDSLVNGQPSMFLGYPVVIDDNVPSIDANAFAVWFGDWKRFYAVVNRSGTTLIRDNLTAKGQTKFKFRRRFGGAVVNYQAAVALKFATS